MLSIKTEAKKILKKDDIDELKSVKHYNESKNSYEIQFENIQQRIEKIEKFKRKTYHNFMEDLISKQEYITYISQFDQEIKELQEQERVMGDKADLQQEINVQYDKWMEDFKDYINVNLLTRDMVLELIDKIEVGKDSSITIYYKFENPYAI